MQVSTPSRAELAPLDAMASLAHATRAIIHVVMPREPGVVDHARALAADLRLGVRVDLRPNTIRVRFDGAT